MWGLIIAMRQDKEIKDRFPVWIFFISLYIWSMFGTSIISGVEIKNGDLEYTQVITRTLYCMSNN
jgi:hypothetical protein